MADMQVIAIFREKPGMPFTERKIGFHSRDVLWYSETNEPGITSVVLCRQGVKDVVFVLATVGEFYSEKSKAEDKDIFMINTN